MMRNIHGFAREGDVAGVIDECTLGVDECSALGRRVAWPSNAGDASGFVLEKLPAIKAGRSVGDVCRENNCTLIIQAHVEVHPDKHATAWVWCYVGKHHRDQRLGPRRPTVNPAMERRAEIERLKRESKSEIAGFIQANMAQFADRERLAPGSALATARD